MLGFLKRKKESAVAEPLAAETSTLTVNPDNHQMADHSAAETTTNSASAHEITTSSTATSKTTTSSTAVSENSGFFARLKAGLRRTKQSLTSAVANLILGKKTIDADLLEELETILLSADLGVATTQYLIRTLTDRVARKELTDPAMLLQQLKTLLQEILQPCEQTLPLTPQLNGPMVILMVGINGAGKTTTTGKLAHYFAAQGKKVMLAAGDTFRAAAVEQLQAWGERNQITVIAQQTGADPAAVIFDALQSAKAKNIDILIADTAGRLHTQAHLMAELSKIKRVLNKQDTALPHETLLVLDASIGQNALLQAQQFNEALGITGLCMTKLDGTAKGGILFSIAKQMQLPIRFIGVGEGLDDLRPFDAHSFIAALFADDQQTAPAMTQ